MSDVTAARKIIQYEETEFRGAISEAMLQKFAATNNFHALYQHSEKQFFINGNPLYLPLPFAGVDGFTFFQFNAQLIDIWMFVQTCGSGGTFELDLKKATTPGGAFTSIFTTTPKIQAAAGSNVWVNIGSALANTTAPVLDSDEVDASDVLRCDIIQAQAGMAFSGGGILVHYRPR